MLSERSNFLLNYLTLDIKDTEIKETFLQFRLQWLNRIFVYGLFLTILNLIWCIFQFFTVEKSKPINLVLAGNTTLMILFWGVLKYFTKQGSIYIPIFFIISHSIDLNLLYRDMVYPKSLVISDKSAYDNQLIYYFLIANIGNFMDFKLTLFVFTPIFVTGQILILKQIKYLNHQNSLVIGLNT